MKSKCFDDKPPHWWRSASRSVANAVRCRPLPPSKGSITFSYLHLSSFFFLLFQKNGDGPCIRLV